MSGPIDTYVAELARSLPGPRHIRQGMLAELDDGLRDAADAHRAAGVAPREAELLAVRETGPVQELAIDYRTELAARSGRHTAMLLALTMLASTAAWDLIWYVVPSAPPLPGVPELARVMMWTGMACAAVCALGVGLLVASARRAMPVRLINGTLVAVGAVAVALIVGSSLAMNVLNLDQAGRILGGSAALNLLIAASLVAVVAQVRALWRTARTTLALGR